VKIDAEAICRKFGVQTLFNNVQSQFEASLLHIGLDSLAKLGRRGMSICPSVHDWTELNINFPLAAMQAKLTQT